MTDTKVCAKCGLELDKSMFSKRKISKDGLQLSCRECEKKVYILNREKYLSRSKENWNKNKTAIAKKAKVYREKNNEKLCLGRKKWEEANRDRWRLIMKRANTRDMLLLSDRYVKQQLSQCGFPEELIKQYPELIETKRLLIKTKRLCSTI